ncbi:hypothetical protein [Halarcobacter ebronensis]|uniref:Uncharacterized protein n=1 Tax=Halarcobacter ebronensis TaxID=1462615 RepID=A0A4Q1AM96_9BACT|nr:hypothetical protein [Halarcobacter ebronensis]QKF81068.1 putative membrane protein [Halarcobacter ebronensis]RXK06375.1 hypothetical protein CRV07_06690 [Halarcobacter ebronensis]
MNKEKLKKVKDNFDKITSQNSTNWKLVLFWIFLFEVVAAIVEFIFVDKYVEYSVDIPHTLTTEILVGLAVTAFVWYCIFNIVFFDSAKNRFRLLIITLVGLYFVVTNDFSLQFLLNNLNPLHFFELDFGAVLILELLLKLVILYLIYQLIISAKNNRVIK